MFRRTISTHNTTDYYTPLSGILDDFEISPDGMEFWAHISNISKNIFNLCTIFLFVQNWPPLESDSEITPSNLKDFRKKRPRIYVLICPETKPKEWAVLNNLILSAGLQIDWIYFQL